MIAAMKVSNGPTDLRGLKRETKSHIANTINDAAQSSLSK
jgi:hypothetical protein